MRNFSTVSDSFMKQPLRMPHFLKRMGLKTNMYATIEDYLRHASPSSLSMDPPKLVRSYSTYGISNFSPKVMHGLRILQTHKQPTPQEREALESLSDDADRLFLDCFKRNDESVEQYRARYPLAVQAFSSVSVSTSLMVC